MKAIILAALLAVSAVPMSAQAMKLDSFVDTCASDGREPQLKCLYYFIGAVEALDIENFAPTRTYCIPETLTKYADMLKEIFPILARVSAAEVADEKSIDWGETSASWTIKYALGYHFPCGIES